MRKVTAFLLPHHVIMHNEPEVIQMPAPVFLGDIKIHAVVPSYHTKQVILIVTDDPRQHFSDIANNIIEYRWNQIEYTGTWELTTSLDGGLHHRSTGAYIVNMPELIETDLQTGNEPQLQLRIVDTDTVLTVNVKDHGLRTRSGNDTIQAITALKTIYLSLIHI